MDYDTLWSGGGHCWSVSSHLCTGFAHRPWIPLSSGRSGGSEGVAGRWEAPPGWEAGWERPGGRLLERWPPERRRWRRSWEGTGIHRSGWCTACLLYRHHPGAYTHRCLRTEGRGVKRKKNCRCILLFNEWKLHVMWAPPPSSPLHCSLTRSYSYPSVHCKKTHSDEMAHICLSYRKWIEQFTKNPEPEV